MSIDLPDFVSDEPSSTPAVEAPAPEAQAAEAAPAAEAPEGQPRGPDGKFAPVASQAEAAPAVDPAAPPAAEPHAVPVMALLDEREKRQAAEARASQFEKQARELQEWRQQQEAQARRQPVHVPDPAVDPEAYRAFQDRRLDDALYEQRREISQIGAVVRFGAETVDKAFEWGAKRCDEDQVFNLQVRQQRDPVGFVVQAFQQAEAARRGSEIDQTEFQAFQAWKAAQTAQPGGQPPASSAPASAAPPPAPAAPRPSIAAAPSAAGHSQPLPRDGGATYDAMFS